MSKRLEVLFVPSPSAANPNPKEQLVYRGKAKTFDEMWATCASRLPNDFLRINGTGVVIVGREDDPQVKNPSPNSPFAIKWSGTDKSGSVQDFLRRHTMLHFPAMTASLAEEAPEAATA